jgi:hypothetical protein
MKFGGRCAYCGIELPERGWHADHVEPVDRVLKMATDRLGNSKFVASGQLRNREADTIENLFPACAPCNIDKRSSPLYIWRKRLEDLANNCRRTVSAFRHAERFGRVTIVNGPVIFWFEKYQASARETAAPMRLFP